jgi:aryl-alcohol dehydrogenase-like predicted oxidoreductase
VIQENHHRPLGASGIKVSSLGTGTNRWAQGKNDEAVFQAYQSLLDVGVNFFDTAEVYNRGKSERLLGACLHRDSRPVVIASKFAPLPTRLSRRQFMNALDASLSRLEMQTIDLYYIHFPFGLLSIETLMDMMAQAVEAGKIRAVGVSNFNATQMRRAATRLLHYHIPLAANQVRYNLLNRQPEENGVLDTCRELNVALVAYRPLEWGRLKSNKVPGTSPSGSLSTTDRKGEAVSKEEEALQETLQRIAHQRGKSVSQVALNWLLRRDEHVIPIPGTTSDRHALENADTLSWELSDDEFRVIDQASSPWKQYTGRESRKLFKDVVSFGIKRWFGGRS